MHRPPGCARHALCDGTVAWGGDVGPAHAGVSGAQERGRQVREPVGIGVGIVVEVGDDVPGGRGEPRVARVGEPTILGLDQAAVVLPGDRGTPVGGPVVHHDHFVIGVGEAAQPLEAVPDGARAVVGAHDHRHPGPRQRRRERNLHERLAYRRERRLGRAVGAREPERPVSDPLAVPIPLVRPGEHEHSGTAGCERGADLPVERARLHLVAVAQAVEPELAHHQRAVAGEVLEPGDVAVESFLRFEVDVEAQQVQERQPQVFGGGVVYVGHQAVRVFVFHDAVHPLEIAFHLPAAQPAGHRSRDLVAERVAQQGRMTGARAHLGTNRRLEVPPAPTFDQSPDQLLGREPDHHVEAVTTGGIEQRARCNGVRDADGIDPAGGHLREVSLHGRQVVIFVAVRVRLKRAVRDALDVELFVTYEEELAAHLRPDGRGDRHWMGCGRTARGDDLTWGHDRGPPRAAQLGRMTDVSVVHLLALRLRFPIGARAKLRYTAHPVPQLRPSGLAGRKPCAPLPSAPWPAGIVGGRRCQRLPQTRHKCVSQD